MDAETISVIAGEKIGSLAEFCVVIGEVINGPGGYFGADLYAFNDCLRGDFGTPDAPYVLRWTNSAHSRAALSYPETACWLAERAQNGHSSSRPSLAARLEEAKQQQGETLFDMLVEIIGATDGVRVELL